MAGVALPDLPSAEYGRHRRRARGPAGRVHRGALQVGLDPDGRTALVALGAGWSRVGAEILALLHLAQTDGSWDRLKVCRSSLCRVAFYDRSRNRSGAWHDVHVCGNAVNLRASRERRRQDRA